MSSLGRASALLGAGTLVSRVTGLVRTIVLVAAIGSVGSRAADAFGVANQLPNNLFTLIQTGILTAVIIPQIIRAVSHDDGGQAFISKLFTLGTVVFLGVTAVAMLVAPWLVALYAGSAYTEEQFALATAFAYWCLPQIFFYGLYALIGETLNARRVFGPYTWAPIANNVISIIGFILFIVFFGGDRTDVDWTPGMIAVIAGSATLGIVIQAVALLFAWRKTGLHLRPDFRWRGVGLDQVGKLAGWTFLMVVVGQIAGWVQTRIVSGATGEGPSVFAMQNAWLVFMLPYSIFAISIGTPYFTQISEHAAARRDTEVRADVARCIRAVSLFIVVSTAALIAAAVPASRIFTNGGDLAVMAAPVLICYLVGLLPLSLLFIVQRTFYAYGDTRTPFWFTVVQCVIIVVTALIAPVVVPLAQLGAAVALGQSIAGIIQTAIAMLLLRRRLGGLEIRGTGMALLRYLVAALPAGCAGWGVFLLLGGEQGWTNSDKLFGAIGTGIIGAVTLAVYMLILALLRAPELEVGTRMLRKFLPRR